MASNGEIPEVIVKYHPYKVEGTDVAALRITCSHQKGEPWESLEVRVGKKRIESAPARFQANQTSPQLLQQVAYCKGFYFDRQQALDHGWKFGRSGYRIPEQAKLFVKEAFDEHGRARAAVKVVDDLDSNSSESGSEATLGDENVANTFPAIQAQNMSTPIVQQMGNCPVVEGQHTSPRKPTNNSDESQCRRTCRKEEMGRSQEGCICLALLEEGQTAHSSTAITKVDVQTDQDINTPQLFPNPFERSETDNVQEIGDFGFFIIQMVTVSGDYRRRGIAKTMYKHLIDAAMWRYPYMKFLVAWPLSMMDLGSPFNDMRAAGLDNDHQRHVAQLLTERLHLSMGFVPLGTSRWFVRSVGESRIQSRIAHESRSAQQQQTNQPAQHKKVTELKGQKQTPEQTRQASPLELRGQAKQSVALACDVPESIRHMSQRLRKRRPSSSPSRDPPVLRNSPSSEPPPIANPAPPMRNPQSVVNPQPIRYPVPMRNPPPTMNSPSWNLPPTVSSPQVTNSPTSTNSPPMVNSSPPRNPTTVGNPTPLRSVEDLFMSSLEEYEAADRSLAAKLSLIDEPREGRMYGVQPNDELMTVEEMLEEFD
ncbi:hypothetical protein IWX90DRAFT_494025 [Phyllosticta citrichinensis]|uniref:N-acetyltransferase domain-containing protein n=1 Tax=Phyllosticta citrichinensis TaxID=1130410 RepID=A0ABR1XIM0_9PEZI